MSLKNLIFVSGTITLTAITLTKTNLREDIGRITHALTKNQATDNKNCLCSCEQANPALTSQSDSTAAFMERYRAERDSISQAFFEERTKNVQRTPIKSQFPEIN